MGVTDELAQWVDTTAIAKAILEELEEQEVPATLENGKTIWLDVLEHELPQAIASSVKARTDLTMSAV